MQADLWIKNTKFASSNSSNSTMIGTFLRLNWTCYLKILQQTKQSTWRQKKSYYRRAKLTNSMHPSLLANLCHRKRLSMLSQICRMRGIGGNRTKSQMGQNCQFWWIQRHITAFTKCMNLKNTQHNKRVNLAIIWSRSFRIKACKIYTLMQSCMVLSWSLRSAL